MKNKFQITKAQLQQIIKEEYASMAKENARAEEIKARIAIINEELSGLPETLSEVEAGGLKGVKSTGWTGAGESDKKYDEKFEKIGTHLKEDEEFEGEVEVGGEPELDIEAGDDMGIEMDVEVEPQGGYFEMKFAELGRELDGKLGGAPEAGENEEAEETEIPGDMGLEMGSEEPEAEETEEIEEVAVVSEEEVIEEDLEEPIEGETPAQDSEARFNDYMEKDKHVKESVIRGTTLLSEGKTVTQKNALDKELERMKRLAKI